MSGPYKHLKLGVWNIEGLTRYKIEDPVFLSTVNNHDIFVLCETWTNSISNISIPNFENFAVHRPRRKANSRRDSGEVIVYLRNEISSGVKLLKAGPEDAIWLLLDREFFKLKQNIVLCACYRVPDNSSHQAFVANDMFDLIQENMVLYAEQFNSEFIICGDLNSRTSIEDDFISNDVTDYVPVPDEYICDDVCYERSNEDTVINTSGRNLLELCRSSNLRIVNGRVGKDAGIGRVTCIKYNGSSMVDYILCSNNLLSMFDDFEVLPNLMFSDHCSLLACLNVDHINDAACND